MICRLEVHVLKPKEENSINHVASVTLTMTVTKIQLGAYFHFQTCIPMHIELHLFSSILYFKETNIEKLPPV